jgi:hypothetical protein
MGLFDGRSYSDSERLRTRSHSSTHHNKGTTSHSRGHSPARSTRSQGYYTRPSYSRTASGNSFFGAGVLGGGSSHYNGQSRSIFNAFGGGGSSSYYKRRPRDGYISYLIHKLQRMIKELWYYARRHPIKAFFAVIVPLLSAGGAIHGLMRQFGMRMPFGLDGKTTRMGGGYYGSAGYNSRSSSGGGGGGWMDNAGSLMQIARAFM